MDTYIKGVFERFEELLTHYKRGYEGENTAVNKLRKEPNSVLEQEIKLFIQQELDNQKKEIVEKIINSDKTFGITDKEGRGSAIMIDDLINEIK